MGRGKKNGRNERRAVRSRIEDPHPAVTCVTLEELCAEFSASSSMGGGAQSGAAAGPSAAPATTISQRLEAARCLALPLEVKQAGLFDAAMQGGHVDHARKMIAAGADIHATDETTGATPLILAAYAGDAMLVRLLLEKKADVRATSNSGSTALAMAVKLGRAAAAGVLLENAASLEYKERNTGRSLLHLAATVCACAEPNRHGPAMARLLLANGAAVDAKAVHGATPLHNAAMCDDTDMVRTLCSLVSA